MTGPIRISRATIRRGAPYLLALAGLAWAVSCGDEEPPTAPPAPNHPPATRGTIPDQTIRPHRTAVVDASAYFSDPDGHPLTFAPTTSDASVASVSVLGSTVTVLAEQPGEAMITVTARDPAGLSASLDFAVTVEPFSDREILTLLHEATGGANWYGDENWLSDAPLEEWFGVEVDDQGRVIRLQLYRNNLVGPLPPELAGLERLSRLQLGSNRLSGAIPPELGELSDLSHLGFFNNLLEGPVPPELGSLANLTRLELDRNPLTGLVPRSFLALDRLTHFYFTDTNGLCAPGTRAFANWIAAMDGRHDGPFCNRADLAVLAALHEASGGENWTAAGGWLGGAATAEWHGVGVDSLGRVTSLDLSGNGLTGRLPQNLGQLAHLAELRIGDNALTGRLPESLAARRLRELRYAGTDLCIPPAPSFRAWLDSLPAHEGTGRECAPPSDRDILVALHDATGGPDWTERRNWLTEAEPGDWYGVETDFQGRVTALRLQDNGLKGRMPAELAQLSALQELNLSNNALSGSIPEQLGTLANLTSLVLWNTNLSGAIPPQLGTLAELRALTLRGSGLTGSIPEELGTLANLTSLALDDNALDGRIPRQLGNLVQLESLTLSENDLTGPIPPELGGLSSLSELHLGANGLTGPIPPELGSLDELRILLLSDNKLTGPVPAELGALDDLFYLSLEENRLTGPIPGELGALAEVRYMMLADNDLTGPIPPRLGQLARTFELDLTGNRLTGEIPAELGELTNLVRLSVSRNDLSGPLPPELGGIRDLRELDLTGNAGLTGALPERLTDVNLRMLAVGGTDLCAPSDDVFLEWLEAIPKRRVTRCADEGPATAYLTQAVQSRTYPVPLVAGDPALLRVFVATARAARTAMPPVRARFFLDGIETWVADIASSSASIPTDVDEGDLAASANAEIPGEVIQPGLEMVIEIDPEGTLDSTLGVVRRIPEEGRRAVDVRAMPALDLTLVPFLLAETPDSSILALTRAAAADPNGHELLHDSRTLLPIGELAVTVHEPVLISSNNAYDLFRETVAIMNVEGARGHYMGTISGRTTLARGLAFVPGRASFSVPDARIIAHELGHNMNLRHAPCGGAGGADPSFPEPDGSIGAWGYDFRRARLVSPGRHDLMSYCEPPWISDYYFTNALRFRILDEADPAARTPATPARTILLWGGVDAEGEPFLEPAFVLDAPANLPRAGGEYRLTGHDVGGRELFSLHFDMPDLMDGDGGSSFAFLLPVEDGWAGTLARITLSGPGGADTLDERTARPMAILRNPQSGQVRGILRHLPPVAQAARDGAGRAAGPGLEVLLSLGLPSAETWRR